MKLKEKHMILLDSIPLNKWDLECAHSYGAGITRSTITALKEMGILQTLTLTYPEIITDEDVAKGFVKIKLEEKDIGSWRGQRYIKKIVSDYRTRDYEVEELKNKMKALQNQIDQLEKTK